jgi:hypothetical protein
VRTLRCRSKWEPRRGDGSKEGSSRRALVGGRQRSRQGSGASKYTNFEKRERGIAIDARFYRLGALDTLDIRRAIADGVLEDRQSAVAERSRVAQSGQHLLWSSILDERPRWIGHHEIERALRRDTVNSATYIPGDETRLSGRPERRDVRANGRESTGRGLHENGGGRAARNGFERKRPCSRIKIEHPRSIEDAFVFQNGKERFAHAIRRRARLFSSRGPERSRTMDPTGDAHGAAIRTIAP